MVLQYFLNWLDKVKSIFETYLKMLSNSKNKKVLKVNYIVSFLTKSMHYVKKEVQPAVVEFMILLWISYWPALMALINSIIFWSLESQIGKILSIKLCSDQVVLKFTLKSVYHRKKEGNKFLKFILRKWGKITI